MESSRPELLAPLNDWKTLTTQSKVLDNADSVYFGLQGCYSNRQMAGNFPVEELEQLVNQIHEKGKKCYLATNIIIYDEELVELHQIIEKAKDTGVDAVICHDIATMMIAKQMNLPFHVSTQVNVSNRISAKFFESIGANRIILARELDLDQIKVIANDVKCGIECFIHGAMCMAVSGRCYFSAEMSGFNKESFSNRGKCLQPCRRTYTLIDDSENKIEYDPHSGMFFNAKDLCMIEYIPDLIHAGIKGFKIEGRMRDPIYIDETTACYREAIDSFYTGTYTKEKKEGWVLRLSKVFNRGFHTGFYFQSPGPKEIQLTARGNQAIMQKKLIGRVTNYFQKNGVIEIELNSQELHLGQNIIFENQSDLFHQQTVESLQINRKSVSNTPLATADHHVIVSMKVSKPIPQNANVYLYSSKN